MNLVCHQQKHSTKSIYKLILLQKLISKSVIWYSFPQENFFLNYNFVSIAQIIKKLPLKYGLEPVIGPLSNI